MIVPEPVDSLSRQNWPWHCAALPVHQEIHSTIPDHAWQIAKLFYILDLLTIDGYWEQAWSNSSQRWRWLECGPCLGEAHCDAKAPACWDKSVSNALNIFVRMCTQCTIVYKEQFTQDNLVLA